MAITAGTITPIILILGAFAALAIAIFGRKGLQERKADTEFNKKLRLVSGAIGAIMIFWAFLMVYEGTWTEVLMLLMFVLLGLGLLLPVLPRTNMGTILALVVAAIVGYLMGTTLNVNIWIVLIGTLIVFFALFLVFKVAAASMKLLGTTIGARWILLVLGFVAIAFGIWKI